MLLLDMLCAYLHVALWPYNGWYEKFTRFLERFGYYEPYHARCSVVSCRREGKHLVYGWEHRHSGYMHSDGDLVPVQHKLCSEDPEHAKLPRRRGIPYYNGQPKPDEDFNTMHPAA